MNASLNSASLSSRVFAFGYDYLLISSYLVILGLFGFLMVQYVSPNGWADFFSSPLRADLLAFSTTILPVALYFSLTESSPHQASWGKLKRGLKVESVVGNKLSFPQAFSRSLLKLLPWQIAHTCLFHVPGWPMNPQTPPMWVSVGFVVVWMLIGAYALSIGFRANRMSFYDQLCKVRVVSRN